MCGLFLAFKNEAMNFKAVSQRDKPVFQNYLGYCWNHITSAICCHAIWVMWNIACKSTVTKMARMQMFEVMYDEFGMCIN